jgi:hypothetical protein
VGFVSLLESGEKMSFNIIYSGRALKIAVGIILISFLVLGCVGEKVSTNASDVKATPNIITDSITPKVTPQAPQATQEATLPPISTPDKTGICGPTKLTEGTLNTALPGCTYDIGRGYNLTFIGNTDRTDTDSVVALKKDRIIEDNVTLYIDKPAIISNVISITVKKINVGTITRIQFTYYFI